MRYLSSPQGLAAVVTALALLASAPAPAWATGSGGDDKVSKSKETQQDVPFNEHSACTNEDVNGLAHSTFKQESSANKFKTTEHENGKGTGMTSTARYEFNEMTQHETITTAKSFTDRFDSRKHLIRTSGPMPPGVTNKNDDMFLREFVRTTVTNGNPEVTVEGTRLECK